MLRAGWGLLLSAAGLCAQQPAAKNEAKQDQPTPGTLFARSVTTPDGSRFLLVPTGGPPVIYWVTTTPAGDLVDPPGYPGLSFAVARASLSGTDTIGTSSWIEERKRLREVRQLRERIRDQEARGEPPSANDSRDLTRALKELASLRDETAWMRSLMLAPSVDVEMQPLPDTVVFSVATTTEGFSTVARLRFDRRENARLRTLERDYGEVRANRASDRASPRGRLLAEVRELAFAGLGGRESQFSGTLDDGPALDLFRRTHNPAASYHVLTGGFDAKVLEQFLKRQFQQSGLDSRPAPTPALRPGSRERSSSIEVGTRSAVAIAFQLDERLTPLETEILAHALAGGSDSALNEALRARDFLDVDLHVTTPFPATAAQGFLLIEAWQSSAGRGARHLERAIEDALDEIFAKGLQPSSVQRAHRQALFQRQQLRSDPLTLARWLAVECGIRGTKPRAVLRDPDKAPNNTRVTRWLRQVSTANRVIVRVEAER